MSDDVLRSVLDGLEASLELERELGAVEVEVDRSLLDADHATPRRNASPPSSPPPSPQSSPSSPPSAAPREARTVAVVAFVHDRPLSPKASEMMSKAVAALGLSAETAPVAFAPPLPRASVYVFLGGRALRKYIPDAQVEENGWFRTPKGLDALFVRSPEDIVRFATVTPAVRKAKEDMWRALKTVIPRANGAASRRER